MTALAIQIFQTAKLTISGWTAWTGAAASLAHDM
jgi:hypothetical protein